MLSSSPTPVVPANAARSALSDRSSHKRHTAKRRVRLSPCNADSAASAGLCAISCLIALTSSDTAEFLYPELFRTVGTIGHEMMCAGQSFDRSLGETEYEMMDRFVTSMGQASLLCDLVDADVPGDLGDRAAAVLTKGTNRTLGPE